MKHNLTSIEIENLIALGTGNHEVHAICLGSSTFASILKNKAQIGYVANMDANTMYASDLMGTIGNIKVYMRSGIPGAEVVVEHKNVFVMKTSKDRIPLKDCNEKYLIRLIKFRNFK